MVTDNDIYSQRWRYIVIDNVGSCMNTALLTDRLIGWLIDDSICHDIAINSGVK